MSSHDLYVHREKAESIRGRYTENVAGIMADRDLSEEGRNRKLALSWVETKRKLDELGQQESDLLSGRRSDLERKLFGGVAAARSSIDAGAAAISARDAADRAAQLSTADDAMVALQRAEADGDEVLARAIMRHATRAAESAVRSVDVRAWDEVMGAFIDARPQVMPTVEQLAEIETMSQRQIFSPFSLPQPYGVAPQFFNQAQQATREGDPSGWLRPAEVSA